ncbi:HpcH/HpaI aldolase/citrate lyase family protein [Novosphingobium lindaniclasticum]|uniref:HpcH/HpaI aldolase/citrate lyase family protein n=1 Tax=Novosphingobium lindaniclasticum TaxID=1329895 RepID=UPI0003FEFBA9|nr:CoA ester lyase [Novosphingobium lindaniclasticum]
MKAMAPSPFSLALFVPGDRPEWFATAAASQPDAIILDLEDAVAPSAKEAARSSLRCDFTHLPVLLRINPVGTPWHEQDLEVAARLPLAAIVVPKAEEVEDLARVALHHRVVALIETARGMALARDIACSGSVTRLAFGSLDYIADLGCDHSRNSLQTARAELVLASRLGGLAAPLDGVTTNVSDGAVVRDDARYAKGLGFGGKLLIHPRQVDPTREGFRPTAAEADWARQVLDSGDGAAKVDGAMVDEPVRIRARAILANEGSLKRLD